MDFNLLQHLSLQPIWILGELDCESEDWSDSDSALDTMSIWVGIRIAEVMRVLVGTLLATGLRAYAADPDLQQEWMMVKKVNKMRLAEYIESMSGVKTKRIHKFKKAAAKYLGIIHRYYSIERAITILLHCAYLAHLLVTYSRPAICCAVRIYFTYSRSAILCFLNRFEYFKDIPTNTKLALAEDGTCTRSRCFVLRGSAPRKDPTRLAALLPPSDCLAAQPPPSRLEPA
ncbi:unnamed protein product [Prunus armeniaca]